MIRYTLTCDKGHEFDSWFSSSEAFDGLARAGHICCPECGSSDVQKTLMAPGVQSSRKKSKAPEDEKSLTAPQNAKEAALAEIRAKIEANSEYVGMNFANEARAMHEGDVPHRAIYGEAKLEEAKSLVEDGVPVAPLPFTPRSRAN